jgi:hypothetical protein
MKPTELAELKEKTAAAESKGDWREALRLKAGWVEDLVAEGGADGRSPAQRSQIIEQVTAAKVADETKPK